MDNQHHGELLRAAMKSVGMTVAELAKKMKTTRSTIYKRIDSEVIDFFELIRFGRALQYDFSKKIPEIDMYRSKLFTADEETAPYSGTLSFELEECKKSLGQYKDEAYRLSRELNDWKDKYIEISEELTALRIQMARQ